MPWRSLDRIYHRECTVDDSGPVGSSWVSQVCHWSYLFLFLCSFVLAVVWFWYLTAMRRRQHTWKATAECLLFIRNPIIAIKSTIRASLVRQWSSSSQLLEYVGYCSSCGLVPLFELSPSTIRQFKWNRIRRLRCMNAEGLAGFDFNKRNSADDVACVFSFDTPAQRDLFKYFATHLLESSSTSRLCNA